MKNVNNFIELIAQHKTEFETLLGQVNCFYSKYNYIDLDFKSEKKIRRFYIF